MRTPLAMARHARSGLVGVMVAAALALPFDAQAQIKSQVVASGLSSPLAFIPDPTLPDTLYIVQQGGLVRTLQGGVLLSTPFADLTSLVFHSGEQGLLGMAFSPADSNRVFFSYTNTATPHANVVSRYRRSASATPQIDPLTRLDLLWPTTGQRFIPQPFSNHNGGNIAFGPDGYLYVARGDGGSSNDPNNRGQDPTVLLGKILRIDVNVLDTDPNGMVIPPDNPFVDNLPIPAANEIWAFGVRNPWRFSFDNFGTGATGALIIGDVGQGAREEINYEPANSGGRNYGWRLREGFIARPGDTPPTPAAYLPLKEPLYDYPRSVGQSVTGGYVYRGSALGPSYTGRYFYADFITLRVFSLGLTIDPMTGEATASNAREHTSELGGSASLGGVASFGRDLQGELYLVTFANQIRRIDPDAVPNTAPTITNIANQTINEDVTTGALPFTIGDVNDPQGGWLLSSHSSNSVLVPPGNIVFGGSGTSRTVTLTPAPNQFGATLITITFQSRTGESVSDMFVVTVNPVNDPPTIANVANTTTNEDTATGPIAVTVSDLETAAGSLQLTASSNNQMLVPNGAIALSGSGGSRTVTITPAANQSGTATITLTLFDGAAMASDMFDVMVTAVNDTPMISAIPNQTVQFGTTLIGSVEFVVSDVDNTAGSLTTSGTSSNQAVVANGAISFGGSGANRTITLMPTGAAGSTIITVTVSDGFATSTTQFTVTVNEDAAPRPAGDFDGDGRTDIAVFRPSTGRWFALHSGSSHATSSTFAWGLGTDITVAGDYDGDARADIAVFRPSTGQWYILQSSTNYATFVLIAWGMSGDTPVPGDYDFDGRTDPAVYRPSTAQWFILKSSTNYATSIIRSFGLSTDVTAPADYDGDGKTDIALYRPSTGQWFILRSSTGFNGYLILQWGNASDIPVPGDYDGDRKADLAVFRESTGQWYILRSSTNFTAFTLIAWGTTGDAPVPGDYDGDGRLDLGIYRPSTSAWYLLGSASNYTAFSLYNFGTAGDTPVLHRP